MAGTAETNIIGKAAYKIAHFATAYLNVPPNKHRLFNALGLTVGIVGGRFIMNILTGSTPSGEVVDRKDVPLLLRPLHGLLHYDHFSDEPSQRWWKIADVTLPAILGGIGAGKGSDFFFKDGLKLTEEHAAKHMGGYTLADAETHALFHQGRAWGEYSKVSSVFGSASGFGLIPSPLNYSSTLGSKFTLDAGRSAVAPWLGKNLRAKLFNSHSLEPFRPVKLLGSAIEHMVGNPSTRPENAIEVLEATVKTWFKDATPEQINAFTENTLAERNKFIATAKAAGKKPSEIATGLKKHLSEYLSTATDAHERRLIEAGIDPRSAAVGDAGMITTFARWGGDLWRKQTTQELLDTQAKMIEGMEHRHPELLTKFGAAKPADLLASNGAAKAYMGAFSAAGVGTVAAISRAKDTNVKDIARENGTSTDFTSHVAENGHILHSRKHRNFLNGHLLNTAEGITGMFSSGVGIHRLHCAAGLTVGSWLGDAVMAALTGVTFTGLPVKKEDVWKPLQKVFGTLKFNPHSDLPHDKWMQVMRWGIPGIVGGMAVIQGSKLFFESHRKKLKSATYLDEVESKAMMAQSQPWSISSAVSALFGYPSGMPMLPFLNYSTNLGTRFSMASGRKVSLPGGLGKMWSNNPTLFPFGPPGMLDLLIKEAVNNKSHDPELMETYAIGVLKPWFDKVTPEQIDAFVNEVYKVRDKFYQDGGVPENLKKELDKDLKAHLKGAGLEETLADIGLDPLKAHIGNNGISGNIAERMGAKKPMDELRTKYAEGYLERLKHRRAAQEAGEEAAVMRE